MSRHALLGTLLAVLALCCSLAAASNLGVPVTLHRERHHQAHQEQPVSVHLRQHRAQQIEPVLERAPEDAKELRAVAARASLLANEVAASTDTTAAVNDTRSTAEKYGTILSGGVIASVTIVLFFACLLVLLVAVEVGSSICSYVEHRRMRAQRLSKNGDDPAEPKYGDFRDTAVNLQV